MTVSEWVSEQVSRTSPRVSVSALAVALGLAGLGVTGCGVPDRSEQADRITAAVETLPGVADAAPSYLNDFTAGSSYSLRIRLAPDVTAEQVDAIAATFARELGGDGMPSHSVTLELNTDDDADRLRVSGKELIDPAPAATTWFRLADDVPGDLTFSQNFDIRDLRVDTDDLAGTFDALRTDAADLAADPWIVTAPDLLLRLAGGYPDAATVAALDPLVGAGGVPGTGESSGGGDSWDLTYTPTATPTLSSVVRNDQTGPALEAAARERLDVLAGLGVPLQHVEDLPDGETITVRIGGCLDGGSAQGSALQQELNQEYGDC